MAMAANKVRGIRAALAYDVYSAKMSREHNDANIIALRGRGFPSATAARLTLLFLTTDFSEGPRHKRRIKEVAAMEARR